MRHMHVQQSAGRVIAALVFLFMICAVARVEAKDSGFKSMLRKAGISATLVRLDRIDGFSYGLSLRGQKIPAILVAPGAEGLFLVQIDGCQAIFQRDAGGTLQVIQADTDLAYVLCVLNAIITMANNVILCESNVVCFFNEILTLVTSLVTCQATVPTT